MTRYTFITKQTKTRLPDGRTRIYFDEQIHSTPNTVIDDDGREVTTVTTEYSYRAADIPAGEPVNKGTITNAIIRADFSQADVEAIFRHALVHPKDTAAKAELATFDAAAEAAKARAVEILEG